MEYLLFYVERWLIFSMFPFTLECYSEIPMLKYVFEVLIQQNVLNFWVIE